MANSLNQNIAGKLIIVRGHKFRVADDSSAGFGAFSFTSGTAVFGRFEGDTEDTRISGYEIEALLPDDAA
jgi:hypothetical protein